MWLLFKGSSWFQLEFDQPHSFDSTDTGGSTLLVRFLKLKFSNFLPVLDFETVRLTCSARRLFQVVGPEHSGEQENVHQFLANSLCRFAVIASDVD